MGLMRLFVRLRKGETFARWRGVVTAAQLEAALKLIDGANDQFRKVIDHVGQQKSEEPKLRRELAAAEKEKAALRTAMERNMKYTQALISNLEFLKGSVPE